MFALIMSEDRLSMQARRQKIIEELRILPGEYINNEIVAEIKNIY